MASGNSSNANRYKGEDIDTDGDGKVNSSQDTDAIDGLNVNSSSITSGQFLSFDGSNVVSKIVDTATPDGSTIIEDDAGEFVVNSPQTKIIGDFESDLGAWNETGSSFDNRFGRKNFDSTRGDFSVFLNVLDDGTNGTNGIKANFDVTGWQTLKFGVISGDFDNADLKVQIGSTTVATLTDLATDTTVTPSIDVSGFSGSKDVKIFADSTSSSFDAGFPIDFIRVSIANVQVDSGAGN